MITFAASTFSVGPSSVDPPNTTNSLLAEIVTMHEEQGMVM